MSVYTLHHVATLAIALVVASAIGRARWSHRDPRVAVMTAHLLGATVLLSALGILLGHGVSASGRGVLPGLAGLARDVTNGAAPSMGWTNWLALSAGLVLTMVIASAAVLVVVRQRARRKRLRHLLDLVRSDQEGATVLLEHPAPVAYCIPGRRGRVVMSSGAIDQLTDQQIHAVIAHERAHLRHRHGVALLPFTVLRVLLPGVPWTRRLADEAALLLEMCADDSAARSHGRSSVATALQRFSAAAPPAGALGVADRAIDLRVARLTSPGPRPATWPRLLLMICVSVVAATPLSLFALPV